MGFLFGEAVMVKKSTKDNLKKGPRLTKEEEEALKEIVREGMRKRGQKEPAHIEVGGISGAQTVYDPEYPEELFGFVAWGPNGEVVYSETRTSGEVPKTRRDEFVRSIPTAYEQEYKGGRYTEPDYDSYFKRWEQSSLDPKVKKTRLQEYLMPIRDKFVENFRAEHGGKPQKSLIREHLKLPRARFHQAMYNRKRKYK